MSFISELKRRNVFKVGAAYAIVAWLLIQIASILFPTFNAPVWVMQVFTVIIILGFPIALVLAWAFELTPAGIKHSGVADVPGASVPDTSQKFNYIIIILLAIAVVFLVLDNYVFEKNRSDKKYVRSEESGVKNESPATETDQIYLTNDVEKIKKEILPNSVAVLPFENLSPDPDDAYFAAGIHEEILTRLAQIQDLKVIARTSVLNPGYTDGSMSIPAIAQELNVETVMEGSVRYAGDQVRVTAQLIDGRTNTHLWSDTFDGDLTDIFRFQTEIASQIAAATQAKFPPDEVQRVDKQATDSLAAYALYLKSRALAPDLRPGLPAEFYQLLDQAIAIDPDFALAHAVKATGLGLSLVYGVLVDGMTFEAMDGRALEHTERAMALDPDLGKNYLAQGYIHWSHQRGTPARQAFDQALQLSPNDVDILDDYARFLGFIGAYEQALQLAQRAISLAPNDGVYHWLQGNMLLYAGDYGAAAESLRKAVALNPAYPEAHMYLGFIELRLDNGSEALSEFRVTEQLIDPGTVYYEALALLIHGYARLGLREDVLRLFERFNTRIASGEYISAGAQALAYLAIGQSDIAFDVVNRSPNEGAVSLHHIKTNILDDPILESSRFIELRRRIGIIGGTGNLYIPPF